jgi:hypothetical protein
MNHFLFSSKLFEHCFHAIIISLQKKIGKMHLGFQTEIYFKIQKCRRSSVCVYVRRRPFTYIAGIKKERSKTSIHNSWLLHKVFTIYRAKKV